MDSIRSLLPRFIAGSASASEARRNLDRMVQAYYREKAGKIPEQGSVVHVQPLPVESFPDTRSLTDLRLVFAGIRLLALREYLLALSERKMTFPPYFLPELLNAAIRNESIRPLIANLVGARGERLIRLNTKWAALMVPEDAAWHVSGAADRLRILQMLRASHPDRARKLVTEVWSQESATVRKQFLQTFKTGISRRDFSFLETAQYDRSAAVSTTAVRLLFLLHPNPVSTGILNAFSKVEIGNPISGDLPTALKASDFGELINRFEKVVPPSLDERKKSEYSAPSMEAASWFEENEELAEMLRRSKSQKIFPEHFPEFHKGGLVWESWVIYYLESNAVSFERGDAVYESIRANLNSQWSASFYSKLLGYWLDRFRRMPMQPEAGALRQLLEQGIYSCETFKVYQYLGDRLSNEKPGTGVYQLLIELRSVLQFRIRMLKNLGPVPEKEKQ